MSDTDPLAAFPAIKAYLDRVVRWSSAGCLECKALPVQGIVSHAAGCHVPAIQEELHTLHDALLLVDGLKVVRRPRRSETPDAKALYAERHDTSNAYLPVVESLDLLAPWESYPTDRLQRIVDLFDRDGWIVQRRVKVRERLDALDAVVDRVLAKARARLAESHPVAPEGT